jgi:5-methyltetrahydropteroyltriglutamate--homocysteine methyltransferase
MYSRTSSQRRVQTSVVGYPRIGASRELKFWTEDYFAGRITETALLENAAILRVAQWTIQMENGIDFIPSNDFSFYDGMLDTAYLLGAVPERYRALHLSELDTCFAMARGYQGKRGDAKALTMRKWFNTNYHYIVPELDGDMVLRLSGTKPLDEFLEAKRNGILTKPVMIGPFTFLKLAKYTNGKDARDFAADAADAYACLLKRFDALHANWVQFDEPALVTDLDEADIELFEQLYQKVLNGKGAVKVLLQTYFGDIRDCYTQATALPFDGIGLDFVEGRETMRMIEENGFPKNMVLFAGVVNGKNVWINDYENTLLTLARCGRCTGEIVVGTSCSLLHVPYSLTAEKNIEQAVLNRLAFAGEKLAELKEIAMLAGDDGYRLREAYALNAAKRRDTFFAADPDVRRRIEGLTRRDFIRTPDYRERAGIQKEIFQFPCLPTTTIGSFPQTKEVKANRSRFKNGEISAEQYETNLKAMIASCIALQEELGLDVLVHGEYERNDMVEYFGENLAGFLFTEHAWVQSYGTRCVKPPIICGDIRRTAPITVEISKYAQSLTKKPVKGMLTGPVTILNWSFPREDISHQEMAMQIALAIRDEALDLEAAGIKIIQVDEAALKEKLPLRKSDWRPKYLDWAIPAFRLVHSGVKAETQIHTHMCYSEFTDILEDIEAMDADVISFEASRSDLSIVDAIRDSGFKTAVGPGVYDIHSPRVPSKEEMAASIRTMLGKIAPESLWINPDCGLKTRGLPETIPSLRHLVEAAREAREELAR